MWIRIEACDSKDKYPVGIYQKIPYRISDCYCKQVLHLYSPDQIIEDLESTGETINFWFTEKGYKNCGHYFCNLFNPQALKELGNIVFLISIIEDIEDYCPCYVDDFQVALWHEENIMAPDSKPICSLEAWKQFEQEHGLL